jgi:hypothetical protein
MLTDDSDATRLAEFVGSDIYAAATVPSWASSWASPWPGWASPWLWTGDTWAGLQFGVLVVALIVAWRQVREAARLREDTTRPFASIDLSVHEKMVYLTMTNYGPAMARDVQFEFKPPLRSSTFQQQVDGFKAFTEGIPTLPPGKTIATILDVFPSRESAGGFEDVYHATVTYRGDRGKKYDDLVTLDLGTYRDRISVGRHGLHEIGEMLKTTNRELSKLPDLLHAYLQAQQPPRQRP